MRSKLPSIVLIVLLVGGGVWYFTRDRRLPEERAEQYYKEGYELGERGQFKEAIKRLEKAVKLNPRHTGAHVALGACYYQEGRIEMAKQACVKALELDPSKAEVRVAYVACVLKSVDDRDEAWTIANRELAKLTEKDRRNPYVAYNLACLYAENDRQALALRYLSYAIEKAPSLRKIAKHDNCLDSIRHTEEFRRLVE